MTQKQQTTANLKLLEKLTDYLIESPPADISKEEKVSYVLFSADNAELNKMNEKLLGTLIKEGETVVKAEQTKDKKTPWKFTSVAV